MANNNVYRTPGEKLAWAKYYELRTAMEGTLSSEEKKLINAKRRELRAEKKREDNEDDDLI